jgi:hypothetical protein
VYESEPSNTVGWNVNMPPAPFLTTPVVTWIAGQGYQAAYTWFAVSATSFPTGYIARLSRPDGTTNTSNLGPAQLNLTVGQLPAGYYSFSVAAVNAAGEGAASVKAFVVAVDKPKNFRARP